MLDVINVGQGDCLLIQPPENCEHAREKIFVDLGPGKEDITKYFGSEDCVSIILTHHDKDHFDGIRFFVDKMKQVKDIFIPLHQNEITIIANSILKLKGIRDAENCDDFIQQLEQIVANQAFLKALSRKNHRGPRLRFAYEGKTLCGHLEFLNPPKELVTYNWIEEADHTELALIFEKCFESDYTEQFNSFFLHESQESKHKMGYRDLGNGYFDEVLKHDEIEELLISGQETNNIFWEDSGIRSYIVGFFIRNLSEIETFNQFPSRDNMYPIIDSFVKCTHDACIVLKMSYGENSFLLTGDASKKVFRRLIKNGICIKARYLKMPHHGSKENMDEEILDAIDPEIAIISHDNRRFGRAKDPHPNQEILEMLQERKIKIMLTNDVRKHNVTVMKKATHLGDGVVNIF